jgi:hypothetical protein
LSGQNYSERALSLGGKCDSNRGVARKVEAKTNKKAEIEVLVVDGQAKLEQYYGSQVKAGMATTSTL